jgi:hypothetical protein
VMVTLDGLDFGSTALIPAPLFLWALGQPASLGFGLDLLRHVDDRPRDLLARRPLRALPQTVENPEGEEGDEYQRGNEAEADQEFTPRHRSRIYLLLAHDLPRLLPGPET